MLFYIVVSDFTRGTGRYNLALGAAAASWGLGAALSNGVAGMIVNGFGFSTAFFFLAACALGALGIYFFAVPDSRNYREPEAGEKQGNLVPEETRSMTMDGNHGPAGRNLEHRGVCDERGHPETLGSARSDLGRGGSHGARAVGASAVAGRACGRFQRDRRLISS